MWLVESMVQHENIDYIYILVYYHTTRQRIMQKIINFLNTI